jgi:hypothetical protein
MVFFGFISTSKHRSICFLAKYDKLKPLTDS